MQDNRGSKTTSGKPTLKMKFFPKKYLKTNNSTQPDNATQEAYDIQSNTTSKPRKRKDTPVFRCRKADYTCVDDLAVQSKNMVDGCENPEPSTQEDSRPKTNSCRRRKNGLALLYVTYDHVNDENEKKESVDGTYVSACYHGDETRDKQSATRRNSEWLIIATGNEKKVEQDENTVSIYFLIMLQIFFQML